MEYIKTRDKLPKEHPLFFAEERLNSNNMSREEHDAEHARMGKEYDTDDDRLNHVIGHILLWKKENKLSDEELKIYEGFING